MIQQMMLGGGLAASAGGGITVAASALLHFDGDFSDAAGNVFTPFGAVEISNKVIGFGKSGLFSGGGLISNASNSFGFEAGDYTISAIIQPIYNSNPFLCIFDNRDGVEGIAIYVSNHPSYLGLVTAHNTNVSATASTAIPDSQPTHIEVVRKNGVIRGFQNGVKLLEVADSRTYGSQARVFIGCSTSQAQTYAGYLDELLVVNGQALHWDNFTPPAQPYALA